MSEVEWFPIPGWEGMYEVSTCGEVRSLDRTTTKGQRIKGKTLTLNVTPKGYHRVGLYRGSQRTPKAVHILVMEATEGPCPAGMEVLHGNGLKSDNRRANLRYGTRSENNLDAVAHGSHHSAKKTHCPQGHEYSPDNTYRKPAGGRDCRRCRAVSRRKYEEKR
ncbi:hypothetical protein SRABI26_02681 [Arthrobacter sp. Bi26]|uniref:NUMOD4 motif-containing HNH endonuclease n=1 Tax=Arthrobacter sp. Bi26 TaxID=2822350 RepID=UPI001DF58D83|nr:NUMOD4 motif-containing HNH endonuclease [Arthrobacter sp. Bi26]CAH0232356.1 hypothetical protein SRABI26_02681 [Arthrobacter sp. Bi26]